jgi:GT2 family glycosyltransferase
MPIPFIIPFYKDRRQLDLCMEALKQQDGLVEPWIWDNTVNNIYYTKAANLGLKAAIKSGQEFAITATQDCYLKPGAVAAMIEFMRTHPRCGLAGIKQLYAANPDVIYHAGCTIAYPAGQHIGGRVSRGDCTTSRKMPWVNGTCIMARIDAVLEFGLMDENLLMLCCDSDWCYTARARNWEVWYCAEAECLHEVGVSAKTTSPVLIKIFQTDTAHFRDKWIGSGLFARLATEFVYEVEYTPKRV